MKQPPKGRPKRQPIFFIDQSIGAKVLHHALMRLGARVRIHDHHFGQGTPDEEWLSKVGEKGWVVLTQDEHILTRPIEVEALFRANTHVFVLRGKNLNGQEIADAFCKALPDMTALASAKQPPFLARVTRDGTIAAIECYGQLARRIVPPD
ncbi:hypothetical protein Pla175_08530 [Pirellulimonas nuda]|uniref:VapC45 PIN like domain-containing protein n=1 Tax=Pirellulimonas nuda TaxID=2528009 RepID=A0A518D7Q3_9BACT|nr:hypothetical protein [Pirellulimonas nuda]QDU87491.1 hypothetical protein Pla175_08530 [Pirellulimonas nuda]